MRCDRKQNESVLENNKIVCFILELNSVKKTIKIELIFARLILLDRITNVNLDKAFWFLDFFLLIYLLLKFFYLPADIDFHAWLETNVTWSREMSHLSKI